MHLALLVFIIFQLISGDNNTIELYKQYGMWNLSTAIYKDTVIRCIKDFLAWQ